MKRAVFMAILIALIAGIVSGGVFMAARSQSDPTFGDTSVHSQSAADNGALDAYVATLPVYGTVTSMSVYLKTHSGSNQVSMAIYSNSGGVPGTLLAQTSSVVATVGWNTLSISPGSVSLSAGTYWLAVQLSGTDKIAYDGGGTGANNRYRTYTYGSFPSTFGTASAGGWYASIYASYVVFPTPSPTPTPTPYPPCHLFMFVDGNGTTDPPVGQHDYPCTSTISIAAVPAPGWMFVNWTGGPVADPNLASTTVTLNAANTTAIANFSPISPYKYRYTTGPFLLPQNSGSLDWTLLNNDSTPQEARVTVFKCPIGTAKTPEPPGPLVVNVGPGEATHNANEYTEGFVYEIQVECNSQLVFPYVSVWPANFGVIVPGTGIGSGSFVRLMP
jgi:hypothetical protein